MFEFCITENVQQTTHTYSHHVGEKLTLKDLKKVGWPVIDIIAIISAS